MKMKIDIENEKRKRKNLFWRSPIIHRQIGLVVLEIGQFNWNYNQLQSEQE